MTIAGTFSRECGLWFLKCNVCKEASLQSDWVRPNYKRWISSLVCRSITNDQKEDMEIMYAEAKRHYMLDGHDWFSIIKSIKGQQEMVREFSLIERPKLQ